MEKPKSPLDENIVKKQSNVSAVFDLKTCMAVARVIRSKATKRLKTIPKKRSRALYAVSGTEKAVLMLKLAARNRTYGLLS